VTHDVINTDLKEIWWEDMDSSGSGEGTLAACCEDDNEHSVSEMSVRFFAELSF
jgi:hypothetical protein